MHGQQATNPTSTAEKGFQFFRKPNNGAHAEYCYLKIGDAINIFYKFQRLMFFCRQNMAYPIDVAAFHIVDAQFFRKQTRAFFSLIGISSHLRTCFRPGMHIRCGSFSRELMLDANLRNAC